LVHRRLVVRRPNTARQRKQSQSKEGAGAKLTGAYGEASPLVVRIASPRGELQRGCPTAECALLGSRGLGSGCDRGLAVDRSHYADPEVIFRTCLLYTPVCCDGGS